MAKDEPISEFADTRKFNGKKYTFMNFSPFKSKAKQLAEEKRKQGYNVRIVKSRTLGSIYYNLYGRKK